MKQVCVINTILVPEGMESEAESVRNEYVEYFQKQDGFVSSTFYRSMSREASGEIKYVNMVVWESAAHYEKVVNQGFQNEQGKNSDGMRVLGQGFPAPITVSPGQYHIIGQTIIGQTIA